MLRRRAGRAHFGDDARLPHRRGAPRRPRRGRRPDGRVGPVRGPGGAGSDLPGVGRARPARPPGDGAPVGHRRRARRGPRRCRRCRPRGGGAGCRRPGRLAARRRRPPGRRPAQRTRRPGGDDLPQGGATGPGVLGPQAVPRDHGARPRRPVRPRAPPSRDRRRLAHRRPRGRRGRRAARRLLAAAHQGPAQRVALHRNGRRDGWPRLVARHQRPEPGDPAAGARRRHPGPACAPSAGRRATSTWRCGTAVARSTTRPGCSTRGGSAARSPGEVAAEERLDPPPRVLRRLRLGADVHDERGSSARRTRVRGPPR